jgi:hypothetical protein
VQVLTRNFVRICILVSLIMILALPGQGASFSNASLQGTYGQLTNRWTADPTDVQLARVGILAFDGVGNVSYSFTETIGGKVMTGTLSGTYAVNPDGTATITWTSSPYQVLFNLSSTAAKVAHGFQYVIEIPGYNEANVGEAFIQSTVPATYSLSILKGSFSFDFHEATTDSTVAIQGGVGLFTFDGKGNVKGSSRCMVGGVYQTATFTGTYVVNPDGSGTIALSNSTQYAFVLNSVAGRLAKGLQFIQTNITGNVAMSGTAQKQ